MVLTNVKTIHQTSLLHIESNLDRLGLLSPTHGQRSQQQSGQITLQSVLINIPEKAPRILPVRRSLLALVGRIQTVLRDQLFPQKPPVRALYFGLATWVQSSHPASRCPPSVPGANLVLTHRLLSSLPLSTAVRQFWCHDRWYERSGLWIQMVVHRQRQRICR